jgi:hypothetical protein
LGAAQNARLARSAPGQRANFEGFFRSTALRAQIAGEAPEDKSPGVQPPMGHR